MTDIVEHRGKGTKIYVAEWDQRRLIKTKMSWGQERHYAKASVLLFWDHLNLTLDEPDRNKLFYSLYLFLGALDNQGTPGIREIIGWSAQIVKHAEDNFREYDAVLEEEKGKYYAQSAPNSVATSNEIISQLERLARLRERGFLSEEEFKVQKKRLLDT